MARFVEGVDRNQCTLFPPALDDYVSEDNPVRAVDVFVDGLNLKALGFFGVSPHETGRPGYHPATMLKLYIFGYLNRIPSSRRLERECRRNLELIWLTGKLAPDFKTIADFRKDHGEPLRQTCRAFVAICSKLELLSKASIAIDGSKFKAVNARDKNFTVAKMRRRLERIDESIARYMSQLETADRQAAQGSDAPAAKVTRLQDKIGKLKEEIDRLNAINVQLQASESKQVSLSDPDARSMATSGKDTGIVGYNVQAAVDTTHHIIVAHEVTNVGTDRGALAEMAEMARIEINATMLDVVADRGYFNSEQLLACEQSGITVTLPKPQTSNAKAEGRFSKLDFVYVDADDVYRCPAGQVLPRRMTTVEEGKRLHRYWTNACGTCPMKAQCTPSHERRVTRWEHEAVLEKVQARLDNNPDAMRVRRSTVEHPFGTIKCWMGATHFLCTTKPKVSAEMALNVLAYNLKRVMAILGVRRLTDALRA
ncbi:IS1182 family transposase [Asticcacaulis sp.]|uniref:IS1182 family transposase n=1 Tax=Asticcacaulis sp. TaxID=1872648 RepID=UPI002BB01A13|nr:IS1182 family transposase [Asticcacaulis sp.]HTM82172.1 IS1182 family transposase [Asticcacaulis sp.]